MRQRASRAIVKLDRSFREPPSEGGAAPAAGGAQRAPSCCRGEQQGGDFPLLRDGFVRDVLGRQARVGRKP